MSSWKTLPSACSKSSGYICMQAGGVRTPDSTWWILQMQAQETAAGSSHAGLPSMGPHLQILLLGQHEGVILIQRAGPRVQGPTAGGASTCSSQQCVGIVCETIDGPSEDQLEGVAWYVAPHQAA